MFFLPGSKATTLDGKGMLVVLTMASWFPLRILRDCSTDSNAVLVRPIKTLTDLPSVETNFSNENSFDVLTVEIRMCLCHYLSSSSAALILCFVTFSCDFFVFLDLPILDSKSLSMVVVIGIKNFLSIIVIIKRNTSYHLRFLYPRLTLTHIKDYMRIEVCMAPQLFFVLIHSLYRGKMH